MIYRRRREDVEDEGQRRRARRGDRPVRRRRAAALHPLHGPCRAGQGVARRRHRGHRAAARPDLAPRARGRRRAAPVDAPGDGDAGTRRPTGRSTASPTTSCAGSSSTRPIAALFELVNEIYRVKDDPARAGEVALRDRDGPLADPAVRAARRRGAVGAAGRVSGSGSSPGRRPTRRSLAAETVEIVVQVNGKLRDRLSVPAGTPEDELRRAGARLRARPGARQRRSPPDDRRARSPRERRHLARRPRYREDMTTRACPFSTMALPPGLVGVR